jgi:hypothetical protein
MVRLKVWPVSRCLVGQPRDMTLVEVITGFVGCNCRIWDIWLPRPDLCLAR